jgi:hypothetical protein
MRAVNITESRKALIATFVFRRKLMLRLGRLSVKHVQKSFIVAVLSIIKQHQIAARLEMVVVKR